MRGSWRLNKDCNIIPPNYSGYHSLSFPFSRAAQQGTRGPSHCLDMALIASSSLQLIWTFCRRGYIIIWHPPTFCERNICTLFNPSTVNVIPWSPDIVDRMHLLFTQGHFFFWQLGWGQYVTIWSIWSIGCSWYYMFRQILWILFWASYELVYYSLWRFFLS